MIVRSQNSMKRLVTFASVAVALTLLFGLGRSMANEMANEDTIAVSVDQAKLVKLPARVATLVVGNPMIADVTLQSGGMVVVTGKGYGATNVIAMDRAGEILTDRTIVVSGPADKVVTIYRGVDRETYSCTPVCERRVTLGDGDAFFKNAMEQAGKLSEKAADSGTVGKGH